MNDVQSTITDIDEVTKKIEVVVPATQIDTKVAEKLDRLSKKATIKGFRKGKAPKTVIEGIYANDAFLEVVGDVVDSSLRQIVKENSIKNITTPEISLEECERGKDLKFSAEVSIYPEPKITGYEHIEIEIEPKKIISEADIEEAIESDRLGRSSFKEIETRDVAEKGDIASVTVQVIYEDKQPTKAEPAVIELGRGEVLEEIEEGIVGMTIGETKDIKKILSEKEDATDERPLTYRITLDLLNEKVLPEVTDEFVVSLGLPNVNTVAEYRTLIENNLNKKAEKEHKDITNEAILEHLRSVNKFMVPQVMVDDEIRHLIVRAGVIDSTEVNVAEIDVEPFRKGLGEIALKRAECGVIVDRIAVAENVEASESDIREWLKDVFEQTNIPLEILEEGFDNYETKMKVKAEVLRDKTLLLLQERTTVKIKETEKTAEEKK